VGIKLKYIKYFATIAEETARLSSALKLKVGCVIVKDNRILSVGYNGTPSGWDNVCEHDIHHHELGTTTSVTKAEVLHAETNAIAKLAQSSESGKDAILFCTHLPCMECAKLIYQSGITEVYYREEYKAAKGSGKEFLIESGIKIAQY
jgi:dCMP deaminase